MGKILAALRIFLFALSLVLIMLILVPVHFLFHLSAKIRFVVRSVFCRLLFFILGVRLRREGARDVHKGPYIIVCNHRSLLDPVIAARYIHAHFVGKAEVRSYPFLGFGANLTGAIFVDRGCRDSRAATRDAMKAVLDKGQNVMLYPEGTTYGGDLTKRFYKGSFEVAAELGVPVIPVVLEYKDRNHYWTQGALLAKGLEQFSGWRIDLYLWIGQPLSSDEPMQLLETTQGQIDEKILSIQKEWGNIKA
jgi:1-acyl-sn-glycerol-3-phosphate acyltransferase